MITAIASGFRNRVSYPNLGEDVRIIAETRFLGSGAWASETGFLTQISVGCQNYRRNPVSWLRLRRDRVGFRNRVSYPHFGKDAKIIAETRFLGGHIFKQYRFNSLQYFPN